MIEILNGQHETVNYGDSLGVRLYHNTDYEDYPQLQEVDKKYLAKAKILEPYFNVSYLMDYDFDLAYKSSPIDGGKEIFEKLPLRTWTMDDLNTYQIPQKVKTYINIGDGRKMEVCSVCGRVIEKSNSHYCCECGQAIDWSAEK